MNDNLPPANRRALDDAAAHLRAAIDLLDESGASGHIAAHADLALNEIQRLVGASDEPSMRHSDHSQLSPA